MRLNAFQKQKLREIGALHAALQEKTLGLSRGLNSRRGEMMNAVARELTKQQQAFARAEQYAETSRNDRFIKDDLPRARELLEDAQTAVETLKAETAEIERQLEPARADSNQSGKVFEALLKHSEKN